MNLKRLETNAGDIIISDFKQYLKFNSNGKFVDSWSKKDNFWDINGNTPFLLPKQVISKNMLDMIRGCFGVNQYCIGCGEWFDESEMTRGDGNDESGYDWYCDVCKNLYSPEDPPWGGIKGVRND